MSIQFTRCGLPDLQMTNRILDLDRVGLRPLVGRHIDLTAIVLDIPFGVGVVTAEFCKKFSRQVDQFGIARNSRAAKDILVIPHRLGKLVASVVGAFAEPGYLLCSNCAVVAHRGAPRTVLLFFLGALGLPKVPIGLGSLFIELWPWS
ncbi:hypothetical protein ACQP0C_27455 [Nocardia sp. CA-129566]|uniref:hypothetical protein n=1 Tax=Nocardia sp. CA-129566 TaxID=3239976 RepID=UPI003D95A446